MDLHDPNYRPDHFIDELKRMLGLHRHCQLADTLGYAPPVISNIYNRKKPITPKFWLTVMEALDLSYKEVRAIAYHIPPARERKRLNEKDMTE